MSAQAQSQSKIEELLEGNQNLSRACSEYQERVAGLSSELAESRAKLEAKGQ